MITRSEVEDLLFAEAAALDAWDLDAWLALLTADCTWQIPPVDAPDAAPLEALFLVNDDALRLRERVEQLRRGEVHAERPRSRTRRILGQVRVLADRGDEAEIEAAFSVWRVRAERTDHFLGCYRHLVRRVDGVLRIARRRTLLDQPVLQHGGITVIV